MARPALPEDRRRDYRLQVRLSEGERRTIEYAAQRCKVPVGTLMRDGSMHLTKHSAGATDRLRPHCHRHSAHHLPTLSALAGEC